LSTGLQYCSICIEDWRISIKSESRGSDQFDTSETQEDVFGNSCVATYAKLVKIHGLLSVASYLVSTTLGAGKELLGDAVSSTGIVRPSDKASNPTWKVSEDLLSILGRTGSST